MAKQSGFLFYARLPSTLNKLSTYLSAEFADGERLDILLPFPKQTAKRWSLISTALHRLWILLKQGNFTAIQEKLRRYIKPWVLSSSNRIQLIKKLKGKSSVIIIDHSLGGGTNSYRTQRIKNLHDQAKEVLIVTYHPALLGYRIEHHSQQGAVQHYQLDRFETILELAPDLQIETIFYNNAVSFPDASTVPAILVTLAKLTSAQLELTLHDYFPFCPSPHLINAQGHYCAIPEDHRVCQECLARSTQSFVPVYGIKDIDSWRNQWREPILAATAIHIFSRSMLKTLSQVYPDLNRASIIYTPHSMAYFANVKPLMPPVAPIRIGVVGNITHIKGSAVVSSLAQAIKDTGRNDIELIVVGTLHANSKNPIRQTDSYRHKDLPRILSQEKINLILFPSIAPETFSYVIHEMKLLELPIIAFNLGAQAEYLSQYPKGLLLALDTKPEELLSKIIDFHRKIYHIKA